MLNQSRPTAAAALAFDRDEWELLATLPRRVLIAALAAAPEDGRRTAEGIAGIEAIASGLASPSPLVREVVGAIYAESHVVDEDPTSDGVQTLAACRYANEVLTERAAPADAAAYRGWIGHIAAVVTGVAQGVAGGAGKSRIGLADSRFLYALEGLLRP
jgi:hypothetical protein